MFHFYILMMSQLHLQQWDSLYIFLSENACIQKPTPKIQQVGVGIAIFSQGFIQKYRAAKTLTPYFEILMALYLSLGFAVAVAGGHFVAMPFLLLFMVGFGYVGVLSLYQRR